MSPEQATRQGRRQAHRHLGVRLRAVRDADGHARVQRERCNGDSGAVVSRASTDWKALPKETPASLLTLLLRCSEEDTGAPVAGCRRRRFELEDLLSRLNRARQMPCQAAGNGAGARSGSGLAGWRLAWRRRRFAVARSWQTVPSRTLERFAIAPPSNAAWWRPSVSGQRRDFPGWPAHSVNVTVDGRLMTRILDRLDVVPLLETGPTQCPVLLVRTATRSPFSRSGPAKCSACRGGRSDDSRHENGWRLARCDLVARRLDRVRYDRSATGLMRVRS